MREARIGTAEAALAASTVDFGEKSSKTIQAMISHELDLAVSCDHV